MSGALDLLNEIPSKKDVWHALYSPTDDTKPPKNYLRRVSYLISTGDIEKKIENGQPVFKVTHKGWQRLNKSYPLSRLQKPKWDGIWRQVIFDIEEKHKKDREFIRRKIKSLGFGMLQESVWISPFGIEREVEEFFENNKVSGEIIVLISSIYSGDEKELAERAFKLETLNESYEQLVYEWEEIEKDEKEVESRRRHWEESYFELLSEDPFLPKELLPEPWFGLEVKKIYKSHFKKPFG